MNDVNLMYKRLWRSRRQNRQQRLKFDLFGLLSSLVNTAMQVLGPLLIIFAIGLIGAVTYTYFAFIAPALFENYNILWWSFSSFGIFILFNILFNYIMCVTTYPGHPSDVVPQAIQSTHIPEDETRLLNDSDDTDSDDNMLGGATAMRDTRHTVPTSQQSFERRHDMIPSQFVYEISSNQPRCRRCDFVKPSRTHHDSVSGECVLRMDHYCPWMANTIGHYNYKYFYLFLLYVTMGCGFIVLQTAYPAYLTWPIRRKAKQQDTHDDHTPRFMHDHQTALFFAFVLCISLFIAVGSLLAWHTYLIRTNQTTIEYYINSRRSTGNLYGRVYRNPYDLGITKNWQSVFGLYNLRWRLGWMLPSFTPPLGNGVDYPTADSPHIFDAQKSEYRRLYRLNKSKYRHMLLKLISRPCGRLKANSTSEYSRRFENSECSASAIPSSRLHRRGKAVDNEFSQDTDRTNPDLESDEPSSSLLGITSSPIVHDAHKLGHFLWYYTSVISGRLQICGRVQDWLAACALMPNSQKTFCEGLYQSLLQQSENDSNCMQV